MRRPRPGEERTQALVGRNWDLPPQPGSRPTPSATRLLHSGFQASDRCCSGVICTAVQSHTFLTKTTQGSQINPGLVSATPSSPCWFPPPSLPSFLLYPSSQPPHRKAGQSCPPVPADSFSRCSLGTSCRSDTVWAPGVHWCRRQTGSLSPQSLQPGFAH